MLILNKVNSILKKSLAENRIKKKYEKYTEGELRKEVIKLASERRKKYGVVWEQKPEKVVELCKEKLPVLKENIKWEILSDSKQPYNILIEGDAYHATAVLNYTHRKSIDLILIDPPYNTGKNDFKYNDKWVNEDDSFKHSKWLNFMYQRLRLSRNLVKDDGLFVVHIDEHEQANLQSLMNELFLEKNFLGTIIWNKKNPKGDAKGIAYQHESLLVFAKNKEIFTDKHNLERKKQNAQIILKKASRSYSMLNKKDLPNDLKEIIRKYKIKPDELSKFKKKFKLDDVNNDFEEWLKNQDFSGGEKAYSFINEDGRVYTSVSMSWPNKKQAPDEYFEPLIHPVTKKSCNVPQRGWRYPPKTMKGLLKQNLIVFGRDETVQPRRKYFLDENLFENIPSIINFGGSDDKLFKDLGLKFENPKPTRFVSMLLEYFLPKDGIVLDFMAGSGTTGHAMLELNKMDDGKRKFILATNNENNISTEICYPRLKKVIKGYKSNSKKIPGLGGNLKYFKTDFVDSATTDQNKKKLVDQSTDMLCLKEYCFKEIISAKYYKIFKDYSEKYLGIIYDDEGIDSIKKEIRKRGKSIIVYVFSLDDSAREEEFEDMKTLVTLRPIPAVILNIYKRIFK